MGVTELSDIQPFTLTNIRDRDLVIKMLRYEDSIIHSDDGQAIYKNPFNESLTSLEPRLIIQRVVLNKYSFDTSDQSVSNYREIFRNYYNSPTDYDKEVLSSVTYMRENKCVYYTSPVINIGDEIPDCKLYQLDGKTETSLYQQLGDSSHAMLCAFSSS